jgi:signal transduction histidine kinase
LERVIADADRLGGLIDLLLAHADVRRERRPLVDVVDQLRQDWQRAARARGHALRVEAAGQGGLDVGSLRAAADPVVENAIDHATGDDPILVRLTLRDDAGGHAALTVDVENSGVGVPPEVAGSLFEPWTGTRNSGLGLWLARESARAAGGELSCVDPGPPHTVFRLVLPVEP